MFGLNRPRMDAVALIMIVMLPFTGVVTMNETLAGFADGNIILIAALFVIGDGLVRTGVARKVGDVLIAKTGSSETKLLIFLMISVCALGSLMSSTAVTAIFIPVAFRIAKTTGKAPGKLMMPLSFAALISGMMTLVATAPNLVVNAELVRQGEEGFGFFTITPFGIPILILGIGYMLIARRWLPGDSQVTASTPRATLADWISEYDLAKREHRLLVGPNSSLAGRSLSDLGLRSSSGVNILAIERPGRLRPSIIQPNPQSVIQAGDTLLVDVASAPENSEEIKKRFSLESLPLAGAGGYFNDRAQDLGMAQVMVPADSYLIGKSIVDVGFRSRNELTVIGLRRGEKVFGAELVHEPLRIGDTLLVIGPWNHIERLQPDDAGVVLLRVPTEIEEVLPAPGRGLYALFSLGVVVALMISGVVPNVQAALIGCLLMGLTGCIDLNSAYRSISWKTLVLIVGMLPFSIALERTGGVDIAAEAIASVTGVAGTHVVLALLFAMTAVLGMFMSNTATAVLMAPVAIGVAHEMEASPYPFAMIVALAASTAFVTPVSSPVNTLVVTPGGYKFGDFVKIGGPFAVVVMILCVFLVPVVLPLYP
jgi:di/tricarboxylate transporter